MSLCISDLRSLQKDFMSERRYLKNVTNSTLSWYQSAFKAFESVRADEDADRDLRVVIKAGILRLQERGLSAVSINCHLGAINAFLKWLHDEQHLATSFRFPHLRTEKKVVVVLTSDDVKRIAAYAPKGLNERRAQTLSLFILDTGLRINEVLQLRRADLDFDNLLVTVLKGKGQKQRIVPFSIPMRKRLFRYLTTRPSPASERVFTTRTGTSVTQRNALRDLKAMGEKLGLDLRFHLLRHTFATNYLRSGGSVVLLRKVLGHSSINTTMLYEHMRTDDLQQVHHRHSLVANQP